MSCEWFVVPLRLPDWAAATYIAAAMEQGATAMHGELWSGAAAALGLAVASGWAEHRRRRRRDLDKVGLIPWPLVQVLAMLTAVILVSVALNLRQ